jgi:hypothetical protein
MTPHDDTSLEDMARVFIALAIALGIIVSCFISALAPHTALEGAGARGSSPADAPAPVLSGER